MRRPKNNLAALTDLANLDDGRVQWFKAKHPKFIGESDALALRNLLREVWRGGARADLILRDLLFAEKHMQFTASGPPDVWSPIGVDWQRGQITYNPVYTFQAGLYELLKHSDKAKVCARPDCPAPYFIAWNRKPRRYCGTDCSDAAKRENDLKWWKDHGDKWRKKRDQQSKRKRGKR